MNRLFRLWPAVLLGSVALGVLPWLVAPNDLPDPVATHWGPGGSADGHSGRTTEAIVLVTLTLVFAAAAAVLTLRRSPRIGLLWVAYGATGIAVGASLTTVVVNYGAGTWQEADGNLLTIVLLLGPFALLGGLGAVAADRLRPAAEDGDGDGGARPSLDLHPGESATWSGTSHARWPWILSGGAVLAAAVLWTAGPATVVSLLGVAAAIAMFASVRVTVGANGVRARPGLVGWPSVRLPLQSIDHAEAIDARPMEWGGWGYRGSLRMFRRAAWVVRGGEGLKVDLTDQRVFVVTVDNAEQAAAVLNGLLQR